MLKEDFMDTAEMLNALERERQLLKEFRSLSEQQLVLLDDESPAAIDGVNRLLDDRADLMLELTAIEATLGTWITQIRKGSAVSIEVLRELRLVNDEIVQLANQVVEIDEQTHWRLDMIRDKASNEMRGVSTGTHAIARYGNTLNCGPQMEMEG
jgi:hypothetical protein